MSRYAYIVDDDEIVRLSLRSLIGARSDHFVSGFASGDAFLDGVEDRPSGVVVLDVNMPGVSGLDVLKQLVAVRDRFAVILITGQGDIGIAVQAMKLGAVDFLEKPYEPETLFTALDNAFEVLDAARGEAVRVAAARARIAELSPRERSVLNLLIGGASNKAMADTLSLSIRTVEVHRANVMTKLDVSSLSAVMRIAFAAGLVEVER